MTSRRRDRARAARQIDKAVQRAVDKRMKRPPDFATAHRVKRPGRGPASHVPPAAWRFRHQLAPLAVIAGVWVLGYATAPAHNTAGVYLLVGGLVAGAVLLFSGGRLDRVSERAYAAAVVLAAAGWLAWATSGKDRGLVAGQLVAGISVHVPAAPAGGATRALVIAGVALALPWWRHYRVRPHAAVPTDLHETWAAKVACSAGALPGSTLSEPEQIPNGRAVTIRLVPGKQTSDSAILATKMITSAYEATIGSVVIEQTPDGAAAKARMMIFEENPLRAKRFWPGPHLLDLSRGTAPIGVYADGSLVPYRFWQPGSGPWHDLISGTTNAGKSRLLDQLLAYERHTPLIVSWVIDPQQGQSLPDWQEAVDWFAPSAAAGLVMLRAVRDVMYARNRELANVRWTDSKGRRRRGRAYFDPTPEMPILSVTIDEAHSLLDIAEAKDIAEDIGKMARKCGIRLRLVTQVPLVSELGRSLVLRDMVASGNVVVFRTASAFSGQVAFNGALPVAPHQLPREWPDGSPTGGLGFSLGASSRASSMRTFLVEDAYDYATTGTPGTLDVLSIEAAGAAYQWRNDPPEVAAARAAEAVASSSPASSGAAAGRKCSARVLELLSERGEMELGELIKGTGNARRTVAEALERLDHDGLVTRTGRGTYGLVR